MGVASLGMYDLPALREANDALWRALSGWLRNRGIEGVPEHLDRERPLEQIWGDPDLLLAQTCGFPLATRWRGKLRYVATPIYDAPGCIGPSYRSRLIVRSDSRARELSDLRAGTVAINEPGSNSGCNLLAAAMAPWGKGGAFFTGVVQTGSHVASARAVAEGQADIAAIDTVTYAHLSRHDPDLSGRLRTIAWSPSAPGLPLVTSVTTPAEHVALLREGLAWIAEAPELDAARLTLLLRGFSQVPEAEYAELASLSDADGETIPRSLAQPRLEEPGGSTR